MSIFDRIGNLGKGLLQSALSGEGDSPDSGNSSQQDLLRRAFDQGRLSAEEYREKLTALSARLTQGRSDTPETTAPTLTPSASAMSSTPTRRADPTVEDRRWEDQEPVKRTL